VANAGISGATAPIGEYPEDAFDATLAVHVRGAFLLCKHAVPHLGAGASIIITSSVVGLTGAPNIAGYSTAKHAQVGLMRTLARELAPAASASTLSTPGRSTTTSSTVSRSRPPAPIRPPPRRPSSR
jgi:NAD(P)-dependent dehydrogenase (short-subunit alcohol dehydrogenase family)